jgi:ligand-binding sensor domain-containing protein
VSCYNRETGKWRSYTKEDGLAHNGIFSIAIDDGQVWIGTHRGLSRYDKLTDTWMTFTERHGAEDL